MKKNLTNRVCLSYLFIFAKNKICNKISGKVIEFHYNCLNLTKVLNSLNKLYHFPCPTLCK